MVPWHARFRVPLYFRIWLAVVLAVAVLTVAFGWLWRLNAEQAPLREVIVRNEAGDVLGQVMTRPIREPGQPTEFRVTMNDGSNLILQFPRRERRAGEGPPGRPWWGRGPGGLLWILGIVAVAVAIGSYPIIRRLTLRLDHLRMGVERWGEGDLSARVDESGTRRGRQGGAAASTRRLRASKRWWRSHQSLLANASHELRSPLARMKMAIEQMLPQAREAGRSAEIEAQHRRARCAGRGGAAGQPARCPAMPGGRSSASRSSCSGWPPKRARLDAPRWSGAKPVARCRSEAGHSAAARVAQPAGERAPLRAGG